MEVQRKNCFRRNGLVQGFYLSQGKKALAIEGPPLNCYHEQLRIHDGYRLLATPVSMPSSPSCHPHWLSQLCWILRVKVHRATLPHISSYSNLSLLRDIITPTVLGLFYSLSVNTHYGKRHITLATPFCSCIEVLFVQTNVHLSLYLYDKSMLPS